MQSCAARLAQKKLLDAWGGALYFGLACSAVVGRAGIGNRQMDDTQRRLAPPTTLLLRALQSIWVASLPALRAEQLPSDLGCELLSRLSQSRASGFLLSSTRPNPVAFILASFLFFSFIDGRQRVWHGNEIGGRGP